VEHVFDPCRQRHAVSKFPICDEAGETTIMTEKPAPNAANEVFTPVRDLPSAPIIFFEFARRSETTTA
jgi:hypothetical protein